MGAQSRIATAWILVGALFATPATAFAGEPTWERSVVHDAMRNQDTVVLQLRSLNAPNLPFPYRGGSPVHMNLGKIGDRILPEEPYLTLDRGQFDCKGDIDFADRCNVAVKVDDGEVFYLKATAETCGPSQCLNLGRGPHSLSLMAQLKSAKRVTIEVPLYKFGSYQYQFNASGFPL